MAFNWSKPFSKKNWDLGSAQGWKNLGSAVFPVAAFANTGKIGNLWDAKHPFGTKKNAAGDTNSKLEEIPGVENSIYGPYIQQGKDAYGPLSKQYGAMNKDPAAYLEEMMKTYKPSEGFDFRKNQALQGAANDAAAQGRRGGTMDVQNEAGLANTLMSQDMQNWLKNTMGAQQYGMQGQQGMYDTGYKAAGALGSDLSNIAGAQASNAYQGQQDASKSQQDMWGNILGLGGAALGGYFGGPGGAAAGGMAGREAGQRFAS